MTWDDAGPGSPDGQHWLDPDEITNLKQITTLGHYMTQTKRYFTIAQSIGFTANDKIEYGNPFQIPIGCIRKVKVLKGIT